MVHVGSWNGWGSSTHVSHLESPQRAIMGSRFIHAGWAHCGPCVFPGLSMLSAHRRRIEPQSPWAPVAHSASRVRREYSNKNRSHDRKAEGNIPS